MSLKTIIKSELLFESLEDRLKSTYRKWCKKMKLKDQDTLDENLRTLTVKCTKKLKNYTPRKIMKVYII
jgi:hypothetical protein